MKKASRSPNPSPLPGGPTAAAHSPSTGRLCLVPTEKTASTERIDGIREGDEAAFERVFREYFRPLCAVVHGYVKSPETAEELVQDLLLAMWRRRGQLDIRVSLPVYLFSGARHRALNWLRHERREVAWTRAVTEDAAPTAPGGEPAANPAESRELAAAITTAIAALPERRRLAFQLTQQAGLPQAEAAAVMGITEKTVAIHLGLARRDLRERLRRYFDA